MLEVLVESGEERLKMHDLFRELAISILRPDPGFMVKAGLRLTSIPHNSKWDGKIVSLGMEGLVNLRSLDISETRRLESIQVGVISSLSHLEELLMQGTGQCKMDSPMIANCFKEMRGLKFLAILTLGVVSSEDHLKTIMCLQGQLKKFSINV
ncbi:hypothetical protein IFM89_035813 [Coptis chinensis]|uniref:Uncharacterized protein n=1 Tax=Coptis chinensis TaxID=261450 RepID=A0A835LXF1_9MAGN|nr:hypothetical protein IFM89_035813 [Coptis chinensis]